MNDEREEDSQLVDAAGNALPKRRSVWDRVRSATGRTKAVAATTIAGLAVVAGIITNFGKVASLFEGDDATKNEITSHAEPDSSDDGPTIEEPIHIVPDPILVTRQQRYTIDLRVTAKKAPLYLLDRAQIVTSDVSQKLLANTEGHLPQFYVLDVSPSDLSLTKVGDESTITIQLRSVFVILDSHVVTSGSRYDSWPIGTLTLEIPFKFGDDEHTVNVDIPIKVDTTAG
ncbi:MAG: hypothetical protein AAF497_20405 [Planctomycetota bacterium]